MASLLATASPTNALGHGDVRGGQPRCGASPHARKARGGWFDPQELSNLAKSAPMSELQGTWRGDCETRKTEYYTGGQVMRLRPIQSPLTMEGEEYIIAKQQECVRSAQTRGAFVNGSVTSGYVHRGSIVAASPARVWKPMKDRVTTTLLQQQTDSTYQSLKLPASPLLCIPNSSNKSVPRSATSLSKGSEAFGLVAWPQRTPKYLRSPGPVFIGGPRPPPSPGRISPPSTPPLSPIKPGDPPPSPSGRPPAIAAPMTAGPASLTPVPKSPSGTVRPLLGEDMILTREFPGPAMRRDPSLFPQRQVQTPQPSRQGLFEQPSRTKSFLEWQKWQQRLSSSNGARVGQGSWRGR